MKQDEIIELAEKCGWNQGNTWDDCICCSKFDIEAFTKLVEDAAFVRWAAQTKLAVQDEREACAKVCEAGINNATDWDSSAWDQACENRSYAIRARGEA